MKKLLVLMLVLATGGLASAGLMVDYDASTISVGIDQAVKGYEFIIDVLDGDLVLDSSAVAYGFTWEFDNIALVDTGAQWRGGGSQLFGAAQGPGTFLTLGYTGAGTISVSDAYNPGFEAVTMYVPEPVSLMLLGLGGLFLRRRK